MTASPSAASPSRSWRCWPGSPESRSGRRTPPRADPAALPPRAHAAGGRDQRDRARCGDDRLHAAARRLARVHPARSPSRHRERACGPCGARRRARRSRPAARQGCHPRTATGGRPHPELVAAHLGGGARRGRIALAKLRRAQDRAWKFTLAAFPTGLLLLVALLMLLRMLQRHQRAGAAAELAHLEKAAVTDPLTGLRNRRTFDDDLARALRRAASASSCSTSTGSSRRTSVSATRSATSASAPSPRPCAGRSHRDGYRLGGDEFAAILAGYGADAGHRFAHRVQDAMRVQHGGDAPSVAVGRAVGEMRCPAVT